MEEEDIIYDKFVSIDDLLLIYTSEVDSVLGKVIDIDIDESDEQKAKLSAEEICKKLLANQVIEDFKII